MQKGLTGMRDKIGGPTREMLERYSDTEYLCCIIALYAAPTIMRRKAASLITFKNSDSRRLKQIWLEKQERCAGYFPLHFFCLCERAESVSVLCYQTDLLTECLAKKENAAFLEALGYASTMSLCEKLSYLAERYQQRCPHEIGVFLDYPLHDVKAFADCQKACLMTGYWKVYAEEKAALKRFQEFDYSKHHILKALLDGVSPKHVAYA